MSDSVREVSPNVGLLVNLCAPPARQRVQEVCSMVLLGPVQWRNAVGAAIYICTAGEVYGLICRA